MRKVGTQRQDGRVSAVYGVCEQLSGALILGMILFTPWAFGTTQSWAIWTMTVTGFLLGGLLLFKVMLRALSEYQSRRWDGVEAADTAGSVRSHDVLNVSLAILTLSILVYMGISAVNARAVYSPWQRQFVYQDCIDWLPHSYDGGSSWKLFWIYAGLAGFFWAVRDWLLGGCDSESSPDRRGPRLPGRLRLLLWVLCLNGAILGLESILQRATGTTKLLWILEPRYTGQTLSQFGPYAYRGSAASYFNLIWPVCLGFWLVQRRSSARSIDARGYRMGQNRRVLLFGVVLMAACPVISSSRGGAIVAIGLMLIALSLVLWFVRREPVGFRLGVSLLFAVILGLWLLLGWKDLSARLETIFTDRLSNRTEIYANTREMARDFPMFGIGPGAFGALYQLYRADAAQAWEAYVHDDWLETRVTFGWIGLGMILLALVLAAVHPLTGRGPPAGWPLISMIWLAMAGCLVHARFDFPFQIYSIVLLFLLLAAIVSVLSRPRLKG